jgi:hypothetical protein
LGLAFMAVAGAARRREDVTQNTDESLPTKSISIRV